MDVFVTNTQNNVDNSCVDKQSNNHARLDDEASPPRALFAPPIKVIPLDTPEYKTLPFDPRCVGPLRDTPPEDVAFIDSSGWRFTVQRPLGGYTDVFHNAVINALTNHEWESTDQSLSETCQWDDEPANQTMSAERLDTGLACSTAERFGTGTYEFQVGDTTYNYDSVASPRGEHGYWGVMSSTKRTPSGGGDVTVDGFCVNRMKTYPSECIRWALKRYTTPLPDAETARQCRDRVVRRLAGVCKRLEVLAGRQRRFPDQALFPRKDQLAINVSTYWDANVGRFQRMHVSGKGRRSRAVASSLRCFCRRRSPLLYMSRLGKRHVADDCPTSAYNAGANNEATSTPPPALRGGGTGSGVFAGEYYRFEAPPAACCWLTSSRSDASAAAWTFTAASAQAHCRTVQLVTDSGHAYTSWQAVAYTPQSSRTQAHVVDCRPTVTESSATTTAHSRPEACHYQCKLLADTAVGAREVSRTAETAPWPDRPNSTVSSQYNHELRAFTPTDLNSNLAARWHFDL